MMLISALILFGILQQMHRSFSSLNEASTGTIPLIQALLKPVETESGIPYEQTDAYRRKKRKKKGPSL